MTEETNELMNVMVEATIAEAFSPERREVFFDDMRNFLTFKDSYGVSPIEKALQNAARVVARDICIKVMNEGDFREQLEAFIGRSLNNTLYANKVDRMASRMCVVVDDIIRETVLDPMGIRDTRGQLKAKKGEDK